jgi:hypothetical protein
MPTPFSTPAHLNMLLSQRAKLWEELDDARARLADMQRTNAQLPAAVPATLLPAPAGDLSSLDEITQLAHQLNTERATVARFDAEIAATEAAIKRQEAAAKRAKHIRMALILLAVIFVLCVLASLRR